MVQIPRLRLMGFLLLAAIVALAAGLRAGYLITCADSARTDGPLQVETPPPHLETLLVNLKNSQRFALPDPFTDELQDTAAVSPGYPLLMTGINRLVDDAVLPSTMRWIQCGFGALTAGLYFLFARRAFRSTIVAALAGLLCAIHPFWIVDTATLADGALATFLLALALLLGTRASQAGGPLCSVVYGLALAALALVRAELLPFAVVGLAWFLWRSRTLVHGWLWALLAFLGVIIGLAPWAVRNWQLFNEPVPIVDSTYYHLWIGNNPQATGGPKVGVLSPRDPLASMSRSERDAEYARQIRQEWQLETARSIHRRLEAGLYFVFGTSYYSVFGKSFGTWLAQPTGSSQIEPWWLGTTYSLVLESAMLALVVLGLLGWRWTYAWRWSARLSTLAMIWIPLPYVLSHAEALSGPRLPLDGVLLCYAAFALACLFPGRRLLWDGEHVSAAELERR